MTPQDILYGRVTYMVTDNGALWVRDTHADGALMLLSDAGFDYRMKDRVDGFIELVPNRLEKKVNP